MFEIVENLSYLNPSRNFLSSIERHPWTNLWYLNLCTNLQQGKFPIPRFSVEVLYFSKNNFIGNIRSMICNIILNRVLDISHNSLGGTLSRCLGYFSASLLVMDLRMNNFQSTIPDIFVNDNSLKTLAFNGNQLEGLLPKSLVNYTELEVLDLGNNKVKDFFPYGLEALPNLKVLVLKSNKFHGPIGNHKTTRIFFSMLQILDLSYNEFTGLLPIDFFENLNAMMIQDKGKDEPTYLSEKEPFNYYNDSVELTMKGLDIKLQRILTIFTIIDLSSNKFE